jgi:hypothetical protein
VFYEPLRGDVAIVTGRSMPVARLAVAFTILVRAVLAWQPPNSLLARAIGLAMLLLKFYPSQRGLEDLALLVIGNQAAAAGSRV